jgi:hypothetical protein
VNRGVLAGSLGFLLGVSSLSFNVGREIHVPVGGARGPLLMSGLGESEAALDLPADEVSDARRDFYFRRIDKPASEVTIPLRPRGTFSVALRMDTTVRTRVSVARPGLPLAGSFVSPGPWATFPIAEQLARGPLDFTLHFDDAPLVQRTDTGNFRRYVDAVVLRSDVGFDVPWTARIAGGLVAGLFALLGLRAASFGAGLAAAVTAPILLAWASSIEPVGLSLGLPRLLGFGAATVALIAALCGILRLTREASAALALMGAAMVFTYGFLSFLPKHSPPDLDIHIWRAIDLGKVPPTYEGWLRYGSHYPTPSQSRGAATEALGEGPAIPYSPLPYVVFFAAHALGLDLHWAMVAICAASLALLLPLVFAFARAASSDHAGFLAAALLALDLAMIHRLGRVHSPAVMGGALGLACLLAFGLALPRLVEPGRYKVPALLLGLGALGYSSTPLFYALFGVALLSLALSSKDVKPHFKPVALTLAAGGSIALLLYYGHYIPGLLRDGGGALAEDAFPGRTFFIFHNESRQSLRLWRLGLFVPLLAVVPALPLIITRGSAIVRSFLLAWIAAWAGIMLLKEPFAFPMLLRWAKEDFYVAPSLALIVAIALGRIESRPLRIALGFMCLAGAALLRARDYGFHADTLRFLR